MKCRKNTESRNLKVVRTKNGRIILLSKCEVCDSEIFLAEDKFMPEMHLRQPGFTYSSCGPFTKKQRKNTKI